MNWMSIMDISGFFITISTLILSLNINKKVNNAVDKHEFQLNREEIVGEFNAFIKILKVENSNITQENINNIFLFITKLETDYSFTTYKMKYYIWITKKKSKKLSSLKEMELATSLTKLKSYYEKESKK